MRAVKAIFVLAVSALAAGGCLKLDIPDGFACSKNDECPSPYKCDKATHKCRRGVSPTDGGNDGALERPDAMADSAPDLTASPDAVLEAGLEAGLETGTDTGPVETGCPNGQHKCAGACVANDSIDHCGAVSCDKCAVPATGAAATCDGTTCGFTCASGTKPCKDKCIANTACCADGDCAPQGGKVGQCDTGTNMCSYACNAGTVPCAGGCIPAGGCCVESDCPGACQTCAANKCASVTSKDDADSCKGTCDATGACKSKQGQACTTVAAGCVAGTTCAPDGVCCNTACTEACKACDLAASPGTCTVVPAGAAPRGGRSCGAGACAGTCTGAAAGTCVYPTGACGAQTCSGINVVAAGTCATGTCNTPAPTACLNGFACVTNACKTTCATDADCAPDRFCGSNGKCLLDAVVVGAGGNHTCVVLVDGSMRCWGANGDGQLGNGQTSDPTSTPQVVAGLGGAKATMVAAGRYNSCAVIAGGTVRCWGENAYGQLGDPSLPHGRDASTTVGDVAGATAVSVGDHHACALIGGGMVKCWGINYSGQIGNNMTGMAQVPATVVVANGSPLTNAVSVSAGTSTSCAALTDGSVWCWGSVLGTTSTTTLYAKAISGVTGATAVVTGGWTVETSGHACAIVAAGGVRCWGVNLHGQLGDNNDPTPQTSAVALYSGLAGFASLAAGAGATCGVRTDGTGRCWGANTFLGGLKASDSDVGRPIATTGLANAVSVSMGFVHACARLTNGSVQCWGTPGDPALGTNVPGAGGTPTTVAPW